jgi:alkanesulfonate monooxygenase SsuD/methylene tetrahydromethanopterin reductase-like flavin-dependent oxidoreductase (luciferase family)
MELAVLLPWVGWSYEQARTVWTEIEQLGFDTLYVGDDLYIQHFDHDPDKHANTTVPIFEPWTMLPVIAATTKRMRIGTFVSPCGRRHPAVFAKMTSNVDIISGGRLIVGMGLGNTPDQFRSIGQPYLKSAERALMLREELTILKSMWTQERTNFDGKFYKIVNGINSPKPVQKPHPQILIGFRKPAMRARIAAELADRVNIQGQDDAEVTKTLDALEEACDELGRDYSRIIKSRFAVLVFTDREIKPTEIETVLRQRARTIGWDPSDLLHRYHERNLFYVGPPSNCAAALLERTRDIGIDEIVIWGIFDQPGFAGAMTGYPIVAREVLPRLKKA